MPDSSFVGGKAAEFFARCRAGDIVPVTPSEWSAQAVRAHGIEPIVLPHGVDTASFRPGLSAEARAFHARAQLPPEMLTDRRSVVFMSAGAMTANKNGALNNAYCQCVTVYS